MKFSTAAAPHLQPRNSVARIMWEVLLALSPAAVVHVWYFGPGLFFNIIVAVTAALGSEALMLHLRGRPIERYIGDGSAVLAAVLLAFALPPLTPWWITATGSAFAMIVVKHLYGGLGFNVFNPAMAGYVVLLISFPGHMSNWTPPNIGDLDYPYLTVLQTLNYTLSGRLPDTLTMDALTRATPLDAMRSGLAQMQTVGEIRVDPAFGDFGGRGWEWIGNFIIIGGIYLLWRGIIRWHIPVAMLVTIMLLATISFAINPDRFSGPGFHLFAGATLLGAFFIATDPVSAAASNLGRLIYGAGIGVLVFVIRNWGGYPDGVAFAVLLMNLFVPLLDRYTRPRVFGT